MKIRRLFVVRDRALHQLAPVPVPRLGFPELGPPAFGTCRAGDRCCGAAADAPPCHPTPEYLAPENRSRNSRTA